METQTMRMGVSPGWILFLSLFLLGDSIRPTTSEVDMGGHGEGLDTWNSTWIISPDHLCPNIPDCSCSSINSNHITVTCSCTDPNQIVNLERGRDELSHNSQMGMTLWIGNCSHVRIHPHAFSSIDGSLLQIQLHNLPHLEIMESAFEINSQLISRNLIFDNVSIRGIPSKGFPSSLSSISFIRSEIGLIASAAFKGKTVGRIMFQDSTIRQISAHAFDEEILINNSWTVVRCQIGLIEPHGIESSITNMTWTETEIGLVGSWAMSGIIPSATFTSNIFKSVDTNGLTLKDWTFLRFINNTFDVVRTSGIDLTLHSAQFNTSLLYGNTWGDVGMDWIKVGPTSPSPYTIVRQNRLLLECSCSSTTFVPQLTSNGSSQWFQEEMANNTECQATVKGALCLGRTDDPSQRFISYQDWPLLCSESTFLCLHELSEVGDGEEVLVKPQLVGRLRLLVIFVGTVGLAIALALIAVFCVYMCRRDKSREEKDQVSPVPRMNGHQVNHTACNGFLATKVTPLPKVSGTRPRSSIFEDVEMEDKGVQTMPSELSNHVLEGLREKLTDPDSFWDAKETIDHLYDLIHVREDNLPSPPDVTVSPSGQSKAKGCQSRSTSTSTHHKVPSHLPPVRSSSLAQGQEPNEPIPRYAQIRSKPKTSSPLPRTDYPSTDLPPNVYAELRQGQGPSGGRGAPVGRHPTVCDYTEPKDAQTHVYAELSSFPTHNPTPRLGDHGSFLHQNKTFCVQRPRPMGKLTTPPTVPVQESQGQGQGSGDSPGCHQRPLPSIPPPFSTSTLK